MANGIDEALIDNAKVTVRAEGEEWLVKAKKTFIIRKDATGLTVIEPTVIDTDAGGFAVAVGVGGGRVGGALSVGASCADNNIANVVRAYIGYLTVPGAPQPLSVSAAGEILVNGTSAAVIDALTIGAAVGVGVGTGGAAGLAGSGAGAAAYNTIDNTIEAFVRGTGTLTTTGGDLQLTAADASAIIGRAYGVAIAVGVGTGSVAGALTVGVSIAHNEIGNTVRAFIDKPELDPNTLSLPSGGVRLSAVSTATIQARSCAASIAVAAGKSGGLALSGGGAASRNAIHTDTNAYLKGVVLDSAGDVDLLASNTSSIGADIDAWAISVGIGFGGESLGAGAAAIGAAVARNDIGYDLDGNRTPCQVMAYVENSRIDAGGDLILTALAEGSIQAEVTAAAVAIAGSAGAKGIGLSGAGSGASARNKIATDVKAYLDGGGPEGIVADSVILTAHDNSGITAHVAAVAVAVSFAPTWAVSLAIGVSLARNEIYNTVEAYVRDVADLEARQGPVQLEAIENASINASSVAVAVSAAFGQTGVALSGAGADATNMIGNQVHACIVSSTVTTSPGENSQPILVTAESTSSITATVTAVSGSVAIGGIAVAGSIGVTVAINRIGFETSYPNEVLATIDNSTVASAGDLRVQATATETIASESVAASIAIAGGEGGFAAAGAGTGTWNLFDTDVHAYLAATNAVVGGDLDVAARSLSAVTKAFAIGAAISASFAPKGLAVSVAASTVVNTIQNNVQAYLSANASDSQSIQVGGDTAILADVSAARVGGIIATTAAVSVGLFGLSGGGIDLGNTVNNSVAAYIDGPLTVETGGDVSVVAREAALLEGDVAARATSLSLGAAIGVALIQNEIASTIQARVRQANVTSHNTLIHADSVADVSKTASAGVSSSLLAGAQGNRADADIHTLVQASTLDAVLTSAGDITVLATADNKAKADTKGGAIGAVAVGAMIADVTLGRGVGIEEVEASVGSSTAITAGTLTITARCTDDLLADSTAGGGGVVMAAGAESKIRTDNATLARIGPDAKIDVDALVVNSQHVQDIDAAADSYAFALAAGSGAGVYNDIFSRANVDIGERAEVTAGSIVIRANNQLTKDHYQDSANLRSGSASYGNVNLLISKADIGSVDHPFQSVVNVANGAVLSVDGVHGAPGIFKIEALNEIFAADRVKVLSASGFGVSAGFSTVTVNTQAAINVNEAKLESTTGDIYLTAKTDSSNHASTNLLVATVLTGAAGAEATAVTNATNAIHLNNATIKGDDVYLYAGRDSDEVPNLIDTVANTELTAVSLYPNIVAPVPTADIMEVNSVQIAGNSSIEARENINLVAREGHGGEDRRTAGGVALSLSFTTPYGFPIPGYGDVVSRNSVVVAETASIEAGINSHVVMQIKPVTLQGELTINPDRLSSNDRLLTPAEKLSEAVSFVDLAYGDTVQVVDGASQGGVAGNRYRYIGDPAQRVLSEEDYADTTKWVDVTSSTTDAGVAYRSDFVTDVDYEYYPLNVNEITLNVFLGTVVEVAVDDDGNPVAGGGAAGGLYMYTVPSEDPVAVVLHAEDYSDASRWSQIDPDHDLQNNPPPSSVALESGQIVRSGDALYQYLGAAETGVDLTTEDYSVPERWDELTTTIVSSDAAVTFSDSLENKFYVIKPERLDNPTMSLQDVGGLLLAQRNRIVAWMENHSSNAEAIARYQVQLDLVESTLAELGLMEIFVDPDSGATIRLSKRAWMCCSSIFPRSTPPPGPCSSRQMKRIELRFCLWSRIGSSRGPGP